MNMPNIRYCARNSVLSGLNAALPGPQLSPDAIRALARYPLVDDANCVSVISGDHTHMRVVLQPIAPGRPSSVIERGIDPGVSQSVVAELSSPEGLDRVNSLRTWAAASYLVGALAAFGAFFGGIHQANAGNDVPRHEPTPVKLTGGNS